MHLLKSYLYAHKATPADHSEFLVNHTTLPSLLSSIFGLRCPKCRRGDLFATSAFSFDRPFEQYEHCPKCGQNYFPEPGFYYGAMFISYIGSGFFCLGFVMLLHWVLGWSTMASFALLLVIVGVFFVWWFRFSRAVYFHIVVSHDKQTTAAVDAGSLEVPQPETTAKN